GIRDFHVTGVQTCALPIYPFLVGLFGFHLRRVRGARVIAGLGRFGCGGLGLLLSCLGGALALAEGGGEEGGGLGGVDGVRRVHLVFLDLCLDRPRSGGLLGLRRLFGGGGLFAGHLGDGLTQLLLGDGAGYLACGLCPTGITGGVYGLGGGLRVNRTGLGAGVLVGGAAGRLVFRGRGAALGLGETELGEQVSVDVTELGGRLGARVRGHVAVVVVDVRATATAPATATGTAACRLTTGEGATLAAGRGVTTELGGVLGSEGQQA